MYQLVVNIITDSRRIIRPLKALKCSVRNHCSSFTQHLSHEALLYSRHSLAQGTQIYSMLSRGTASHELPIMEETSPSISLCFQVTRTPLQDPHFQLWGDCVSYPLRSKGLSGNSDAEQHTGCFQLARMQQWP